MISSVFDHMARLVSVRTLQTDLGPQLDGNKTVSEVWSSLFELSDEKDYDAEESYDPWERISLVFQKESLIGWVGVDMLRPEDKNVSACVEPIQPGMMLSADTSALEAAELFATAPWHFFFVLDHTRITGTLHYENLFGLPFKLCLLALTFQLEDSTLKLIRRNSRESWEVLPGIRQKKAKKFYKGPYGRQLHANRMPLDHLLGCTQFCDKGTILMKRRLLPEYSGKKIEEIFGRAEKVRNACAHTKPDQYQRIDIIKRTDLGKFIHDVQALIRTIESL